MDQVIYSIGYAGFPIEEFVKVLIDRKISALIDVRSCPFSQHFADYNKDTLKETLKKSHIRYRNYAAEFGARQEDLSYYTPEGYLDFDKFSKSEPFLSGVKKLCDGMEQHYTFALMCAEIAPVTCHRTILVSRAFAQRGYEVIHLLPQGRILTQKDIETQLLDLYFPYRAQLSLFGEGESEEELLEQAYKKQNAKIGYHMEKG